MGSGDRGGARVHTGLGRFHSMKTLRKKQTQAETGTQAETQRPRPTRRSTILDYVNVVPGTRHLVSACLLLPCPHPLPEGPDGKSQGLDSDHDPGTDCVWDLSQVARPSLPSLFPLRAGLGGRTASLLHT